VQDLKLVISIQDQGAGFDTKCVPDPLSPENVFAESGRGLFLMKSLMDEVKTRRLGSRGMKITMTKYHSDTQLKEDSHMAMMMTITTRTASGVTILDLNGRLILGEETASLRDNLKSLVSTGQKKILLNMEGVSYVDSSGLGALVGGYTSVAALGGQLKLEKLNKKAKDLLQITKLLTVFEVFEDEDVAVKSFK
jgi:anti-sigma B factor antagonist